jgi:hypothetical protein
MTYDHVFDTPASSQTKNGVPTMAVRIPNGISIAAAVRATVSITSRNPPPSSAAVNDREQIADSNRVTAKRKCEEKRPDQNSASDQQSGHGGAGHPSKISALATEHIVDLRVARGHVIEALIELAGQPTQILWEFVGV